MLEGFYIVIIDDNDLFSKSFRKARRIREGLDFAVFVDRANPSVIVERSFMHPMEMSLEVDNQVSAGITPGQTDCS